MIVCVFILDSSAYELVSGSSDVYELRNETVFKEDTKVYILYLTSKVENKYYL